MIFWMKHFLILILSMLVSWPVMAQETKSPAPAKTIIEDQAEADLLLGRHLFTSSNLQNTAFLSFVDEFGDAIIANNDGVYTIKADHSCYYRKPRYPKYIEGGYIRINGHITKISKNTFTIQGTLDSFEDANFSKDDGRVEKCLIDTEIIFTREVDPESEDTDFEEHWQVQNTDHLWESCNEQALYLAKIYTKHHTGPAPVIGCSRTLESVPDSPYAH
jgi:hypothetical protein